MPAPTTKAPVKIHVELLNGDKKVAATAKEQPKEKPAKLMTTGSDEDEDSSEEDEDEDEDMSRDAESEYVASNDKKPSGEDAAAKRKHLRINVEPIVLAPSPDELDGSIAYAKHHRSFSHKIQVFLFLF